MRIVGGAYRGRALVAPAGVLAECEVALATGPAQISGFSAGGGASSSR